jgi:hypothetical protein
MRVSDGTWFYWKEEPKNRKWKLGRDTPEGLKRAIEQGAMFTT